MNILILSCNTGEGHNAAARAIEERAKMRGHEVCLVDVMSLVGKRVSKIVGGGYIHVAKNAPLLFGAVYQLGRFISSAKRKSPVYYANAFMYAGIPIGIMVVICELLKGAIPVYTAAKLLDRKMPLFALVMASPVFGHAYSVFHKGKGGKAIAVSFGVAIGLYPDSMMLRLMIFFFLLFSLLLVIRPHLLRAMLTFMCVGISSSLLILNRAEVAGILIIAFIVMVKHWETYHGEKLEIYLFRKRIK